MRHEGLLAVVAFAVGVKSVTELMEWFQVFEQ